MRQSNNRKSRDVTAFLYERLSAMTTWRVRVTASATMM